jgi:hypothetical protein
MSNAGKLGLAAAGVAVAVVLFFVLRPGDETGATTIPTGTATAPTETTATTTVTTTVEPEGPEPVRITFKTAR